MTLLESENDSLETHTLVELDQEELWAIGLLPGYGRG
jgi:hypothetical protein